MEVITAFREFEGRGNGLLGLTACIERGIVLMGTEGEMICILYLFFLCIGLRVHSSRLFAVPASA